MPQTAGEIAHGAKVYLGDAASPLNWTAIPEARVIPPVGGTIPQVDMSNHDTVAYRDYLQGALRDGNELTIECNEISGSTAQEAVRTAAAAGGQHTWRIVHYQGTEEIFPAIFTQEPETDSSDMEAGQVFRFTIKVVGALTRNTQTP